MIIYNVTVKVELSIAKEWVKWMLDEHMDELVATGMFVAHRLHRLLEQDESDGVTYVAQYLCDSMAKYEEYIEKYAPALREKSNKRFGTKAIGFRTLMEVIS